MLATGKIILGIVIIVISFFYILRDPGKSMIQNMLDKQYEKMDKEKESEAANAKSAEPSDSNDTNQI